MLSYAVKTDLGNQRDNNEDCYLASPELCLWILADGVGGQDAGEVASQIACNTIKSQVEQGAGIVEAITIAHRVIKSSFEQEGRGKPGMASTVVVLQVHGDEYQIAWVGDSRAYLWSDGSLQQLTHDQSLVQRLVDENIISEEEALHHPRRNLVIQALGQEDLDTPDVETVVGEFRSDDKIVLCSDGLTDYVNDQQLATLLSDYTDENELVEQLVSAALATEGKDNITVLAVNMSTKSIRKTSLIKHSEIESKLQEQKKTPSRWWLSLIISSLALGLYVYFNYSVLL